MLRRKHMKYNALSTFFLGAIIAAGISGVLPITVQARELAVTQYIAQLRDDNTRLLSGIASDIAPVFQAATQLSLQHVYSFQATQSLPELQQSLAGAVQYVEIDAPVQTATTSINIIPDDPGFSDDELNIDRQWGLHKAHFPEAWELTKGSRDVIVAVIDTGIDMTHEDFDDTHFTTGYNVQTGKTIRTGSNSDDNGHGTLIAGVIGASTDNGAGIAGSNWDVTLMPIKALNERGAGSSSQIAEGIVWAADHDADVINLSLGGIGFAHDSTLANAITYAFNKNVVIVAAAGNDVAITGGNLDVEPVFPICDDNGKNMIIGVTATDVNDLKPNFANFGKACVDVSAPGKRILSTINHDPASGAEAPDSYAYASGTSLAVPYVSGQAALLKALYPQASNRQIRDRIIATADTIDNLNLSQCADGSCKGLLGGGRINAAESLKESFVTIEDRDFVRVSGTDLYYYINGGKRQPVSAFVQNQRFANIAPKIVTSTELEEFSEGSYAEPNDGTLVKIPNEGTVYYLSKGLKLPITYQVFLMRGLQFEDVVTLPNTEVNSWITGSFLTPPEGSLVRTGKNPTLYWTLAGVLHPINYDYWIDRGLNIFPVVIVPDGDMQKFPKGDPFIL